MSSSSGCRSRVCMMDCTRIFRHRVGDDDAIGDFDDPPCMARDMRIMRGDDQCVTESVQFEQKLHHLGRSRCRARLSVHRPK